MESHSEIEDQVAEWLARRDSGNWSEEEEARLQHWIGASTARRVTYLRIKSTWDAAARLRTLSSGTLSGASVNASVPPPGDWRRSPFFEQSTTPKRVRIRVEVVPTPDEASSPGGLNQSAVPQRRHGNLYLGLATAAGILLAVAGFSAYQFWFSAGDRYMTAVGGFASVPMPDGSKITLNTDSEIRVALTEKERRVDLEQGEAFFEVAQDKTRPFVVRASNKRVIAVGTKFSVRHLGDEVRVLVTEGKVRVESGESRGAATHPDAGTVLLAAGDIARAERSTVFVEKAPAPQVEDILSWREGYLRFHETALADAVADMNRYNTRKIVIADSRLAAIRISGTFRPTQYEAFVRVLRDGFSIHAQDEGERITLTQEP